MKLLEQVRQALRVKHYAYRTEQCYLRWIEQYIREVHGATGCRRRVRASRAEYASSAKRSSRSRSS